jgi:hypothetical protein
MENNGRQISAEHQRVARHQVPSAPGKAAFRRVTEKGVCLGEVELYAVNQAAAQFIVRDLYALLGSESALVMPHGAV